jgi:two-component system response regulator YesN
MNSAVIVNILIPAAAGIVFLVLSMYLMFSKSAPSHSYRAFTVFLLSFAFFIIGRPVQVLSGPHPLPLVFNNLRLFLFCSVTVPMLMRTTRQFSGGNLRISGKTIFGSGIFLGAVYVVFNTLGTTGSYEVFSIGGITGYDSVTPESLRPYFAREITQGVQVAAGLLLITGAILKIHETAVSAASGREQSRFPKNFLLMNVGVVIFGLSFVVGSLSKQWSVYYLGSSASALVIGAGVLFDIKEMYLRMERFAPFVKEDILRHMSLPHSGESCIGHMFELLGKHSSIDTYAVISFRTKGDTEIDIRRYDDISDIIEKKFKAHIGFENFILFPHSRKMIGIAFSSESLPVHVSLPHLFETIAGDISENGDLSVSAGIGRSADMNTLRRSFDEAFRALEFAENSAHTNIIHIDNVNEAAPGKNRYPYREKEALLLCVRIGDAAHIAAKVREYLERLGDFSGNRDSAVRARLYEIVGAMIDTALSGGAGEEKLFDLNSRYFSEIPNLTGFEAMESWLERAAAEIISSVTEVIEDKTAVLINRAKSYIDKNYCEAITVDSMAKELFISPSYFLHLFSEKTGTTFTEYLAEVRIRNAKEMLLKSTDPVTGIAYRTGFNDSNYFSTVFKNRVGCTPSEYRKRNKLS